MDEINILFVDDEPLILRSLDRLLRKEPYVIHFADSGREALKIVEEKIIHIVVSDMKMPEMDGLTLLRRLKQNHPEIIRLVLSAYTQTTELLPCINNGEIFRFITKPLEPDMLKAALNDAIDYHLIQRDNRSLVESLKHANIQLHQALEQQKIIENKLRILCTVDELTSLYNRRQLIAALEQELSKHQRYGATFSGLMLDLDNFKDTNDTHGHTFGDFVLREFAARLKSSVRNVDIPFRYGGEEFFVLLPETDLDQAVNIGWRIVENSRNDLYEKNGIQVQQTVSIGATTVNSSQPLTVEDFLTAADEMLYEAKKNGKNQVCSAFEELQR